MNRTEQAVSEQIEAMGAQVYEIGLFNPSAAATGGLVMIPRTWNAETLVRAIPWLRLQNADGRNIYIRPKGEHNLSLVDDLDAGSVNRMKDVGFAPALVVETSHGNFQAWVKHSRDLPRDVSTLAARKLAQQFGGDTSAADWRHFGRLAGFTNRKPKYLSEDGLFPFVRLIEAPGSTYAEAEPFVASVSTERDAGLRSRHRIAKMSSIVVSPPLRKTIDDFRANPRYGGDATREDLAFAIYGLSHGLNENQVASVIRSRDLSHKGDQRRQEQYVERTVAKALKLRENRTAMR